MAICRRREAAGQRRCRTGIAAATFGVLALAAIWQTGNSLGIFRWNPCDDFAAYLPLLHRLGETGGLIEPFSIRRIAGLGGATTFDSLFTQRVRPPGRLRRRLRASARC